MSEPDDDFEHVGPQYHLRQRAIEQAVAAIVKEKDAEIARLRHIYERYREALKPFAAAASDFDYCAIVGAKISNISQMTVRDLRSARAALAEDKP